MAVFVLFCLGFCLFLLFCCWWQCFLSFLVVDCCCCCSCCCCFVVVLLKYSFTFSTYPSYLCRQEHLHISASVFTLATSFSVVECSL